MTTTGSFKPPVVQDENRRGKLKRSAAALAPLVSPTATGRAFAEVV
jgi:hypothetical protein